MPQEDNLNEEVAKDIISTLFGVDPEAKTDDQKFFGPTFNMALSFIAKDAGGPGELAVLYLELPLGQIVATTEGWDALVARVIERLDAKHGKEHRFVSQEEAAKMIRDYHAQLSFEALAKSGVKFHEA
jgi:hypothetical protein